MYLTMIAFDVVAALCVPFNTRERQGLVAETAKVLSKQLKASSHELAHEEPTIAGKP